MQHRITDEQQSAVDILSFEPPQRSLSRSSVLVFLLATLLYTNPVLAGSYEIIQGKGEEVCEAYAKNLNSFNPAEPMLCERPANPALKDFSKPAWQSLTVDQIAEIYVEMADQVLSETAPSGPALNEPKSERIRKAKEGITATQGGPLSISMKRANVDLDNDGRLEVFAKEMRGRCEAVSPPIVLLQPIGKDAFSPKLLRILQSAMHQTMTAQTGKLSDQAVANEHRHSSTRLPDIFAYKGGWYLDIATTESARYPEYLYIFKHWSGVTSQVCLFRFTRADFNKNP